MAFISTIGAGIYSDMSVALPTTALTPSAIDALVDQAAFDALFATYITPTGTRAAGTFTRLANVREFPAIGTPPNIVNVPVYGQKTSQQVQGQSDAPNMELQINYVAADWGAATELGELLKSGETVAIRFALMNNEPDSYASTAAGIGSTPNAYWYFIGKFEALLVTPSLSDANTATLTLSVQSDFYGAYTI